MIAFSGGTPYQIINIINIKQKVVPETPADLFVHTVGGYAAMQDVASRIRELSIFENVYEMVVDESELDEGQLTSAQLGFERNSLIAKINKLSVDCSFDLTRQEYTKLFAASGLNFNVWFYNYFANRNKEFESYFYDEGVGQYASKYRLYNSRDLMFAGHVDVDKVQKYKSLMPQATGRFLYEPDLLGFANFNTLKKLPKISQQDKELIEIYNFIFNYKPDNNLKAASYIFFNSGFFFKENAKCELELLELLEKYIPKEKFVVKFHPSVWQVPKEYQKYQTVQINSIPFESCIMNDESFSKKILISRGSSAMITPKLVFGMEPCFISINEKIAKNRMSVLYKTKKIYSKPEKISLVADAHDFEEIIRKTSV